MSFRTESEMSLKFKNFLLSLLKNTNVELFHEFTGLFGIPDYLLVERNNTKVEHIISFELKLRNWRKGLKQAFKYRSFSNEVFVIIDVSNLQLALNNFRYFSKYNIGLGSFDDSSHFKIYYYPGKAFPYSYHLINKLTSIFSENQEKTFLNTDPLFSKYSQNNSELANILISLKEEKWSLNNEEGF